MRAVDQEIRAAATWVFTGGLEPSPATVLNPRARRCR